MIEDQKKKTHKHLAMYASLAPGYHVFSPIYTKKKFGMVIIRSQQINFNEKEQWYKP
jgi:hypothetical protein